MIRIKELRIALGLTQSDFAEQVNLTKNYISLVENGNRQLSDRTISDICRHFGVSKEWLLTGEGQMYPPKTVEDQLGDLFREVALDPEDAFRKKIFLGLAKLNPEDWKTVEYLVDKMLSEQEKSDRE